MRSLKASAIETTSFFFQDLPFSWAKLKPGRASAASDPENPSSLAPALDQQQTVDFEVQWKRCQAEQLSHSLGTLYPHSFKALVPVFNHKVV